MKIAHNVIVTDEQRNTVFAFKEDFEGLFEIINHLNFLRYIHQYETDQDKKVGVFKEYLGFKALCKRILDNHYFMEEINENKNDSVVKSFLEDVTSFDTINLLNKKSSSDYAIMMTFFECFSNLFKFTDEYELEDKGDIREFDERNLAVTKYLVDNSIIYDDSEEEEEYTDSDLDNLKKYMCNTGVERTLLNHIFDEIDRNSEPVEQYSKTFPLHPSMIKELNKMFALNKDNFLRKDIIIYMETYISSVEKHDSIGDYKEDLELSKQFIRGYKKFMKETNFDRYGKDEKFCFSFVPIPTIYKDRAEFVLHLFEAFSNTKDYSFLTKMKKKIFGYNNLSNVDDAILFIQDISDMLRDENMTLEYDCLNNIISMDTSPNLKGFLILAEMIKQQLNIVMNSEKFSEQYHKNDNKDGESHDRK